MAPTQRLAHKMAVITGGSTGIGFATAQAFLQEGARVLITGKDEQRLVTAARKLGETVIPVRADVRKLEDLDKLAQQVREA